MARAMAVQMSEAELRVCLLACLDGGGKVMMAAGWCMCVQGKITVKAACVRVLHYGVQVPDCDVLCPCGGKVGPTECELMLVLVSTLMANGLSLVLLAG